jgi:putative transposase
MRANRECLFGEIRPIVGADLRVCPNDPIDTIVPQQEMILNDAGEMIVKWYDELENKYPKIRCYERIVMPNHFHCIIEKMDAIHQGTHVGAPLRGCLDHPNHRLDDPINVPDYIHINQTQYGHDNKKYDITIGEVVGWLKTMTTNEYIRGVKNHGWKRFDSKLWQRNYWEHIIRSDDSYQLIAEYILQNSSKWNDDQLNPNQKN